MEHFCLLHLTYTSTSKISNDNNNDVHLYFYIHLIYFIVAPEIDRSPAALKAASGANERARLVCRAQASPRPTFSWSRGGQAINVNQSSKYGGDIKMIDSLTFESVLLINKVEPRDYGEYDCTARNDLGTTNETINLKVTSAPDPVLEINILNVTHDSVTVSWVPGFDGGMKASYRVRYRVADSQHYKYEDNLPNSNKLSISGLRMNTLYVFSVQARNSLGDSDYLPDMKKAQTLGK